MRHNTQTQSSTEQIGLLSLLFHCSVAGLLSATMQCGTAAAVPPPFRHGEPAVCRSRPLVTPY